MAMYLLTRGQRKSAYDGIRKEKRNGMEVTILEPVMMEPGKISTTDLNMDSWIAAKVMVKVRDFATPAPAPVPAPAPAPVEVPVEAEALPETVLVDGEAGAFDDDAEIKPSYEELEDGSFKCLLCTDKPKITKTEAAMLKHISSVH
jgi:hypothetical protein